MSKFNVGDKVKYIGKNHNKFPEFYPVIGTIGVINKIHADKKYWVQWAEGTTSDSDFWCCCESDMELIIDTEMTNEEIWEMLRPKMEKNWLVPHWGDKELAYYQSDVINAIAIAYRSGYERAMKGRPFKFGEKKKKGGHWEPVDIENLPKEGTKVRYARECEDYKRHNDWIQLNDTGVVEVKETWFGMVLDTPRGWMKWACFDDAEDCLDMWVEDDE